MQRASSLADGILQLYNKVNSQKYDVHVYLDFALVGNSGF